ncbi:hypothetical protein NEOLEDRAFT_1134101 [Neolentinus lepideus HHB14362 ss-1]|uniref:C2H2-type domain-containing protein n=1 Tax=Neolentinus lepideus HHB14362 ss-1 TaxID=1314782 RepID=A0A165SK06_9AGAM|nr:hypothetical protein NEOLEDRAFT_1134101 [Neolentinus lepideus HHB14362 ss-1]
MSHNFSLNLLAQHKLCLDFSNPGKPPSIQWKPLAQPVSLTQLASTLSIRVNVMNDHNTLALFIVQDPEADSERTSNESSAELCTPDPKYVQLDAPTYEAPADAVAAIADIPRNREVVHEAWTTSPPVQAMNNLEPTPALPTREFPSPSSAALNTPSLHTISEVPHKLSTDHQQPGLFEWLPADSEHDWQRFMKWNEVEQSSNAFPVDITQWTNSMDSGVIDTASTYSSGCSDVFCGSEVCIPTTTGSEWMQVDAQTTTPPLNVAMFESLAALPNSWPSSSHVSPGSTCDADISDSAHTSMASYAEASSSRIQLDSRLRSPSTDLLALEQPAAPYMSDDAQSTAAQKVLPRILCNYEGCNRSFKNEYTYSVHASAHIRKKKKRFECTHCSETFSRWHDMMRHEVSQHGKVPDWTCSGCRRFFSSEMTLKNHKCPAGHKVTRPLLLLPSLQHHATIFQT